MQEVNGGFRSAARGMRKVQQLIRTLAVIVMGLIIGPALLGPASAQCPTLVALTGGGTTWWAFQTADGQSGGSSVGIFAANVRPPSAISALPQGTVVGTQTWNNGGSITFRAAFTGRYTIDSNDCSRGTISFNVNSNNQQFTFVLADTPPAPVPFGPPSVLSSSAKMLMVSSSTDALNDGLGQFFGVHGTAYLLPGPPACKNPADPLAQLDGTNWSLLGTDARVTGDNAIFSAKEVAPSAINPFPRGTLQANKSLSGFGVVPASIQADAVGTYQIYGPDLNFAPGPGQPNCAGGQLFLSGNGGVNTVLQYDFVFAPPFDSNGSRHMLGVGSSDVFPNGSIPISSDFGPGLSFVAIPATHMEAFRNLP